MRGRILYGMRRAAYAVSLLLLLPQLAAAGTASYTTPGTYTFTVPTYGTLSIDVRGAGGGGGGLGWAGTQPFNGQGGGASSFGGSVIGYGGGGAIGWGYDDSSFDGTCRSYSTNGNSGTATGGTQNITGGGSTGGSGGNGSGYTQDNGCGAPGKGGNGGRATKTYATGDLSAGSSISIGIGTGGAGYHSGVGYPMYSGLPGQNGSVTITWTDLPTASCTVSFTPSAINQGESSTLSWSATNANTSVYIENVGYVAGSSGSFSVSPASTTDYSCYAQGSGGSDGWHEAVLTVYQSCTLDGEAVTNGASITAYENSTVPYGSSCVSETRTCSDGTLSGSYQYASCAVSHQSCTLDGTTVAHGDSHTFYLSQVGSPCSSLAQSRTCTDGDLSGSASYQYTACTCAPLYSCSGNDITYTDASCHTETILSCTAPYFCSPGSSSCVSPDPVFNAGSGRTGHLQVQPQLIPKGLTTTVYWNVANVQSCTVTGSNGDSWSGLSGANASAAISAQVLYTLSCVPLEGASFSSEIQQVNVVPVFQEL